MGHPVLMQIMQAYSSAGMKVTNCCLPYVVILYRFADPSGGPVHRVLLQQHAARLRRDAAHQPEAQAALPRRAALRLQAGHALLRTSRGEFNLSGIYRDVFHTVNRADGCTNALSCQSQTHASAQIHSKHVTND